MEILKFILAWLCVGIMLLSLLVYFLKRFPRRFERVHYLNRYLRKRHISFGKLLVILGALHGILSSFSLFSLNWGTVAWVFSILLGVNYYLRKRVQGVRWVWLHRLLSLLFVATMVVHLIEVDVLPIGTTERMKDSVGDSQVAVAVKGTYTPGTYQVTVDAYGPDMVLDVTMSEETIIDIQVISHNEHKSSIYGPALEQIPARIIGSQSVEVDDISGATYTSEGIKEAVSIALSQAKTSENLKVKEAVFAP